MTRKILRPDPSSEIEILEQHLDDNVVGTIGICTKDAIHASTVMSLMGTDFRGFASRGEAIERHFIRGAMLTWQRNELIRRMRGDWILFIDADMVWEPDAVERLITRMNENGLEMVSGLCFMRQEPHRPTMFMRQAPDQGLYNALETWDNEALVEVDATGMAFCAIKMSVFEKIMGAHGEGDGFPPYEERIRESGPPPNFFTWDGAVGEDLRFCQAAKAAGVQIFVDTSVKIGHMAETVITERSFLMQVAARDEIEDEAFRMAAEQLGLPHLDVATARRRLGWS